MPALIAYVPALNCDPSPASLAYSRNLPPSSTTPCSSRIAPISEASAPAGIRTGIGFPCGSGAGAVVLEPRSETTHWDAAQHADDGGDQHRQED